MAWYKCAVNEVGPGADGTETSSPVIYINLTDTEKSFSNTWFYAADGIKDYLLDVGIAAVSGNKYVEVAVYPPKPGNSPYTEITRIYERAPIWQPAAPTNLHVINVLPVAGDASSITVGWTDNSDNEAGFSISTYGYSDGKDNKYGETTVQDNVQTATLTGLTSGYTYDITVAAFNTAGQSKGVSVTAAIPYVPPAAPRTITVSKQGTGSTASAVVTGSGFTPNSLIVIRIVPANLLNPLQFSTTAGEDGKFSASKAFSCVSGILLTFTAFEDANPTGTISNPVSMTC